MLNMLTMHTLILH